MAGLLDTAPAESVAVLDRLLWGPPYGAVTDRPAPHLTWLLDHGLLLPAGARNVVLPREAALHLRGGRAHRAPEPMPPALAPATERDPQLVDNAAASQAFTALATVEELLKEWDLGGPSVLRAGGLSVRDLKRTAVALDTTEQLAAFWLELAYAAGLVASDGEADERYATTPAAEEWLELPDHERWAVLAAGWLSATRTPGVVGTADAKGRALAALGPAPRPLPGPRGPPPRPRPARLPPARHVRPAHRRPLPAALGAPAARARARRSHRPGGTGDGRHGGRRARRRRPPPPTTCAPASPNGRWRTPSCSG